VSPRRKWASVFFWEYVRPRTILYVCHVACYEHAMGWLCYEHAISEERCRYSLPSAQCVEWARTKREYVMTGTERSSAPGQEAEVALSV
jgi:hypothetical protein